MADTKQPERVYLRPGLVLIVHDDGDHAMIKVQGTNTSVVIPLPVPEERPPAQPSEELKNQ